MFCMTGGFVLYTILLKYSCVWCRPYDPPRDGIQSMHETRQVRVGAVLSARECEGNMEWGGNSGDRLAMNTSCR